MPPLNTDEPLAFIEQEIKANNVLVFSKSGCKFSDKIKSLFTSLNVAFKVIEVDELENVEDFTAALKTFTSNAKTVVPAVFVGGNYVGDANKTLKLHQESQLLTMVNYNSPPDMQNYDYDLIVVGGGSGGLAASKEAADMGAKVALLDFVVPTPLGTTWGLGGTCVNVGCIPKKLMHQAALLGHGLEDARCFGWDVPEKVAHTWETMKDNIQAYIGSLNWGYRVQLRSRNVNYINSYGELLDPHKVKATSKSGTVKEITGKYIIIAPGMRPKYPPDVPGAREFCVTSDDLFSLPYCPGRTLVVGGSYVALESAGFLASIGLDVTVMVRSIFLRGFDQQCANKIGDYMAKHGTKFVMGFVPTKVEQIEEGTPGKLRVHAKSVTDHKELVDEYNTVVLAIGRDACTKNIGLDKLGINMNPNNGKLLCVNEQTNIRHIYGVGDIVEGELELTPLAIQQGRLLARRLFGRSKIETDYRLIPTTVFTPLEYGSCGFAEEAALAKFGEENIEVYHTNFWPLEWTVPKKGENTCYAKLVCLLTENERVVGFHVLGPNAGEITQGFALAMKLGATKTDFDACIGIHPTCAEIYTMLQVTKRSGQSIEQAGC